MPTEPHATRVKHLAAIPGRSLGTGLVLTILLRGAMKRISAFLVRGKGSGVRPVAVIKAVSATVLGRNVSIPIKFMQLNKRT